MLHSNIDNQENVYLKRQTACTTNFQLLFCNNSGQTLLMPPMTHTDLSRNYPIYRTFIYYPQKYLVPSVHSPDLSGIAKVVQKENKRCIWPTVNLKTTISLQTQVACV